MKQKTLEERRLAIKPGTPLILINDYGDAEFTVARSEPWQLGVDHGHKDGPWVVLVAGRAKSVHAPLDTITAKERMGLVTIEGEDWQIVDIGMRMLTPRELARCQGFEDSYVFTDKTKSEQVARIGNSVPPPIAAAIVRANYREQA